MVRSFLLFVYFTAIIAPIAAQPIAYGSNDRAGHYVQSGDAWIYYEQYGEGETPLVLLHGGATSAVTANPRNGN